MNTNVYKIRKTVKRKISFSNTCSKENLRDAFTGAIINEKLGIHTCTNCQVHYQEESYKTLLKENNGKCIACNSKI